VATTSKQDREFLDDVFEFLRNDGLLEKTIDWIAGNLNPDDVFSERDLKSWADENGYVKSEEQ